MVRVFPTSITSHSVAMSSCTDRLRIAGKDHINCSIKTGRATRFSWTTVSLNFEAQVSNRSTPHPTPKRQLSLSFHHHGLPSPISHIGWTKMLPSPLFLDLRMNLTAVLALLPAGRQSSRNYSIEEYLTLCRLSKLRATTSMVHDSRTR